MSPKRPGGALGLEHLAHVDGHLGLLVGAGQIPDVAHDGADAHHGLDTQISGEGLLDVLGDLLQVPSVGVLPQVPCWGISMSGPRSCTLSPKRPGRCSWCASWSSASMGFFLNTSRRNISHRVVGSW